MDDLPSRLSRFLRQRRVRRDQGILVAVSGGADSMALLSLLASLGQQIGVAHVHHGLRGTDADADLDLVRERAAALGVPFAVRRVDASRPDGRSPEARARTLRYAALEEMRREAACLHVATAHTLDDQAETLLLRAIRGTGLDGLAAIRPVSEDGLLLRPLLGARRHELRGYLTRRGLGWREDETNRDPSIPRSRLRRDVLPVLEEIHPGALERLASLADLAREAREDTDHEIQALVARGLRVRDGGLSIDAGLLASLSRVVRVRLMSELMSRAGLGGRITAGHLRRIDDFAAQAAPGRSLSLPGDSLLLRDRDHFWLGPAPGPSQPQRFRAEIRPPDPLLLPACDWRFRWRRGGRGEGLAVSERAAEPLVIRTALSRDRIQSTDGGEPRRLKDLFAAARWSNRSRARAVVVERAGAIVWVPGLTRALSPVEADERDWLLVAERLSGPGASC